jgi:hypothetical protein
MPVPSPGLRLTGRARPLVRIDLRGATPGQQQILPGAPCRRPPSALAVDGRPATVRSKLDQCLRNMLPAVRWPSSGFGGQMADGTVLFPWKALAVWCCLASSVAWLSGATASRVVGLPNAFSRPPIPAGASGRSVSALQLNLCDSGIASCFTGRSVGSAAAVIRAQRPDIVTLNEVCRDDVSVLMRAMSAAFRGRMVASAFTAAAERPTGGPFRCRNGQEYGIGVLALVQAPDSAFRTFTGVYPMQDLADPEERVWLCIHAATEFYACTTHTASTSATLAFAQCRYLLESAVPTVRSQGGDDPVILGADFNLPPGRSPDPQSCLPHGYQRADDGSRQDIVTSPGVALRSRAIIDMHGTTDHPGLFVEVTLTAAPLGEVEPGSKAMGHGRLTEDPAARRHVRRRA